MWLLTWGLHGPPGKPHSSWSKLFATNPKCRLAETEYTPAGFKWIRSQMRIQAGLMVLGLDAMRGFGKAIGFVADLQMLCWLNRCSSVFFALLVVMFVYLSKRRVDWQVSFSLDNATIIQTTSNYTLIEECSLLPDQAFEVDQAWASAVGEKLAVSLQEDWLVSKHKYTWTSWTWK